MSRFGRDYLQVGMYTEIMFPEHDVHFIAVNDGVDSTQGDNEFTPFRNIINEWYAKDTSKKIRAVMKVKGNAGEHLTTNAPYGYMKDPDDSKHWMPDREAADVVYEIGLYVMDGFGPSQIARKLRERKILTPAAYYESKGIPCNVKKQGDPYGWDNTTIAGIMDRWREYLGHTVNFKTTKKSYKSKKKIINPESEWVIFENTHEPIWTEAIAEAVKQARQSRRRPTKMGEMGMFSGMMYCADCGSILYQCRATGFRKDQEYYRCINDIQTEYCVVCPTNPYLDMAYHCSIFLQCMLNGFKIRIIPLDMLLDALPEVMRDRMPCGWEKRLLSSNELPKKIEKRSYFDMLVADMRKLHEEHGQLPSHSLIRGRINDMYELMRYHRIFSFVDYGNGVAEASVRDDESVFDIIERFPALRSVCFMEGHFNVYVTYSESGYSDISNREEYIVFRADIPWYDQCGIKGAWRGTITDPSTGTHAYIDYSFPFKKKWEDDHYIVQEPDGQFYLESPVKSAE